MSPETRRPPVLVTAEAADYLRALAQVHTTPPDSPKHLPAQYAAERAYSDWKQAGIGFAVDADPTPTVGGEMPEPWGGMGVEWRTPDGSLSRFLADPTQINGAWYFTPVSGFHDEAEVVRDAPRAEDVLALYDGRVCVWRRG